MSELMQENLKKVLSFQEIFLESMREIDMFTQPMALTYKKRYSYSTVYGVFFTILTVILVLFTSIDNAFYPKYRYVCPISSDSTVGDAEYTIIMGKELVFFSALNDIKNVNLY
jgi:hypothetical protein